MDDDSAKPPEQLRRELAALRQNNSDLRQQRAVEGAAERIREQVLAMQSGDDLYALAAQFMTEVRNLGVNTWYLSIAFIEGEEMVHFYRALVNWSSMSLELKEDSDSFVSVLNDAAIIHVFPGNPVPVEAMDERLRADKIHAYQTKQVVLSEAADKRDPEYRRRQLLGYWRGTESAVQRVLESMGTDTYYYQVPFSHGVVAFADPTDSEANIETMRILAEAFSLGYQRFLEFERLEQQATQARLERAVERVRAEAMAMRSSDDMNKVVAVLHGEMVALGMDNWGCGVHFLDEPSGQHILYLAATNPRKYGPVSLSSDFIEINDEVVVTKVLVEHSSEEFTQRVEQWRAGKVWYIEGFRYGEAAWSHLTGNDDAPPAEYMYKFGGEWQLACVPFAEGYIGFGQRETSAANEVTVQKLATALSLGYRRFLDFERLENQNRDLEQALQEIEQTQEALVRSESLAAIGTLAAGAAHELNNPIGAASSLVQSVREMVEEDTAEELAQDRDMIVEHLNLSHRELARARDIVANLLDLSSQSQDYTEAVDLQTVAQDALRGLHGRYSTEQTTIEEEYQVGLPMVQGNFAQLVQVALNLITNAVDALGESKGQIILQLYAEGDQVVLACRDTGIGMSDQVRQDIFKPFFTTKAPGEGTGLGLYVAHQIVDKHGGSIAVESAEGKGTIVRVGLPLS